MSKVDAERKGTESHPCAEPTPWNTDLFIVAHHLKEITFDWGDSYDAKVGGQAMMVTRP